MDFTPSSFSMVPVPVCNIQCCEIVADTVLPMEMGLYQPIGGLTHQTSRWSVISFKGLHRSSSWRSSPWRKAPLTSLTSPFSILNSASRKTGRKVGELRPNQPTNLHWFLRCGPIFFQAVDASHKASACLAHYSVMVSTFPHC